MTAETYEQLKARHEAEFSTFPIAFAFSGQQLAEAMIKLNATTDQCVSVWSGGIIRKADKQNFLDLLNRHDQETAAAILDDGFLIDALHYELVNHEYTYTGDPSEALEVLGITRPDARQQKCLEIAIRRCWQ